MVSQLATTFRIEHVFEAQAKMRFRSIQLVMSARPNVLQRKAEDLRH